MAFCDGLEESIKESQGYNEQLLQQVQQMQEALNEAIQHAKEAQADADEAMEKAMDKHAEVLAKDRELDIKAFQATTDRLKLQMTAMSPEEIKFMVAQTIEAMLSHPDPLPNEPKRDIGSEPPEPEPMAPMDQSEPMPPVDPSMQP